HEALAPFAIQISAWKKRIAWMAYERENLDNCSCLHALSQAEAAQCRDLGLRNPIAVIPNGISAEWLDDPPGPCAFRKKLGLSPESRIVLYLGRLHRKKGISMLLDALAQVRPLLRERWQVVIAGVDEGNHESELREQAQRLALSSAVVFPGPLFGAEKRDAYAAADLFVLPSYSEGFPISVLEALAAGVPVFTTTAVPLDDLRSGAYG